MKSRSRKERIETVMGPIDSLVVPGERLAKGAVWGKGAGRFRVFEEVGGND